MFQSSGYVLLFYPDLLRKEVGHMVLDYIHDKVLEIASTEKIISGIAYGLGAGVSAYLAFHPAVQEEGRMHAQRLPCANRELSLSRTACGAGRSGG